jgi:hypothetical protein
MGHSTEITIFNAMAKINVVIEDCVAAEKDELDPDE